MSQENVELIRRGIVHFDETGDQLWELIDPQIELVIDPFANLGGTYVGHEGVGNYFSRLTAMGEVVWVAIDRLIDAGDLVLLLGHVRAHVSVGDIVGSDMTVKQLIGWVYRLRGGRVVAARMFLRQEEALEAVGLSE